MQRTALQAPAVELLAIVKCDIVIGICGRPKAKRLLLDENRTVRFTDTWNKINDITCTPREIIVSLWLEYSRKHPNSSWEEREQYALLILSALQSNTL